MKKILIAMTLLVSMTSFAQDDCLSNKEISRKTSAVKYLSMIGFGEKQCTELVDMMENGEACDDVEKETIFHAQEVAEYFCD